MQTSRRTTGGVALSGSRLSTDWQLSQSVSVHSKKQIVSFWVAFFLSILSEYCCHWWSYQWPPCPFEKKQYRRMTSILAPKNTIIIEIIKFQ